MVLEKVPFRDVLIYIRTSTDEQNPENQLKDCESIRPKDAKTDTFVDYHLIEDKNSAWKDDHKREGFNQIIKFVKKRKIKSLIVWDLDRIYRNRKRLISFFSLCRASKVSIYSFRQGWLNEIRGMPEPFNDMMFDFMLQIMGWIAEEESTKKSERVKSAVRIKAGKTYSYKGNKWGRKGISTFKKNKIRDYYEAGHTIREISAFVFVSVGAVHKYICIIKEKSD